MSIDLKTASIEPLRRTFDHIAARLGPDKNPSRYQEAVWGLQPSLNFHYRPTWDPAFELYDARRTAIVMKDFDDLVDPRQYYYGTWTVQRGRQQDAQERNFDFVEKRALLERLDDATRQRIAALVIPLRHVAWAANANNSYICAYGFGAPVTSACMMQAMDHLGIAQYISRIGLLLAGNEATLLDRAKQDWLAQPMWQPLRALVEDSMVTRDWFELFVLQNLLIDGAIHPLVFTRFDGEVAASGGTGFSLLIEFMVEWHAEASRWVDGVVAIAAGESPHNRQLLESWLSAWTPRVQAAVQPLADFAFGARSAATVAEVMDEVTARARKCGLAA